MSGIYIPSEKIPTKCVGCAFRDPEYGGNCILMPSFDANTYEEQFDRCPFKKIRKWFGAAIPPHGRLIDADALMAEDRQIYRSDGAAIGRRRYIELYEIDDAPTIIPADPADKEGEG